MDLKQATTLSLEISIQDSNDIRQVLKKGAEINFYFHGTLRSQADRNATTDIKFKYEPIETITIGSGTNKTTETGIFAIRAYISALTTANLSAGDYKLVIRASDKAQPLDDDIVDVIYEEKITVIEVDDVLAANNNFQFTIPTE